MKLAIGSQRSGFPLKECVKQALLDAGHEVEDLGQLTPEEDVSFIEVAKKVAGAIHGGHCTRGILVCGSGAGISLAANKLPGIYCVACESVFMAEKIVPFNNVNVMAMGAYTVSQRQGAEMAVKFAASQWGDGFEPSEMDALHKVYHQICALETERLHQPQ